MNPHEYKNSKKIIDQVNRQLGNWRFTEKQENSWNVQWYANIYPQTGHKVTAGGNGTGF